MKIQKKKIWEELGGGGGKGRVEGGQGGCERRIEVFVKIQKNFFFFFFGGGGGGGWVEKKNGGGPEGGEVRGSGREWSGWGGSGCM